MDTGTVGDEVWKSVRLAWREELWLPAGAPVAAVAWALWVGLTGAAVTYLAGLVGTPTVRPWTGLTDLLAVTFGLLWLVGPAALAALLVRDRLANVRGNLRTGYRLDHPILLLVPPVVLLATGLLALAGLPARPAVGLAILVAGTGWLVVRTLAYASRVFSLSLPPVGHAITFLAALSGTIAALVLGARAAGRGELAVAVAEALAARTGLPALSSLADGTVELVGVAIPSILAAVVALPVGLSAAYVGLQLLASVVVRLQRPQVRRPELRTGQRYPAFAKPTTAAASGGRRTASAPTGEAAQDDEPAETAAPDPEPAADDEEDGIEDADHDVVDDVSHTRVYRPPERADAVDPASIGGAPPDASAWKPHCPACGEAFDPDVAEGTCPNCGADLP